MLISSPVLPIPPATVAAARAAFPNGNVYMKIRDELGLLYADSEFAALFAAQGRPAEAPGRLALVLVFQHMEGLSDRQAADNVRRCIDWKYALGLELSDPGFDYSVLSEFRARLIAGAQEQRLLDDLLAQFQARGWVQARGRQRTDSTHILAATRHLNRLECVGETVRQALNDLARVAPQWVLTQVSADWFDLYGPRIEQYRLPKDPAAQTELAERIGRDGAHLLHAVQTAPAQYDWLAQLPAIAVLHQVWAQQYTATPTGLQWRAQADLPANQALVQTPYDVEARNRTKRDLNWTGYAAHVTETCDRDTLHVITHIETTPATTSDNALPETIHAALAAKQLLPREHYMDTAYVSAAQLVASRTDHAVTLVGPVPQDVSWQAQAHTGYDLASFAIDWEQQTVTCPQGQTSPPWRVREDSEAQGLIEVRMPPATCAACPVRAQCTHAAHHPRTLKLRPQPQHEALQHARHTQTTPAFQADYQHRAGIEGTLSQAVRGFALRRTRYLGLAKTHLGHLLTAVAINLTRLAAWLEEIPLARTRVAPFAALALQFSPAAVGAC